MLRRLQLCLVFAAWLAATGSQWDAVQIFAWGRMICHSSRTMPLADAVRATFAPERMCSLCQLVQRAKQTREAGPLPETKFESKIVLFCQPVPRPVVEAPDSSPWSHRDEPMMTAERATPPLPPPRCAAA